MDAKRQRAWNPGLVTLGLAAMAGAAATLLSLGGHLAGTKDALAGFLEWLLRQRIFPSTSSPALLLVIGGVATLSTVTGVLVLRSALPSTSPPAPPPPRRVDWQLTMMEPAAPVYRGPRDQEFDRGRTAGSALPAKGLDDVLEFMMQSQLGEPRILRSMPNLLRLRLHACKGCAGGRELDGCAFEAGFIESSFSKAFGKTVIVHEVRCRGRGDAACDFEVWY